MLESKLDATVDDVLKSIADIQNGRLKILRICTEVEELVNDLKSLRAITNIIKLKVVVMM